MRGLGGAGYGIVIFRIVELSLIIRIAGMFSTPRRLAKSSRKRRRTLPELLLLTISDCSSGPFGAIADKKRAKKLGRAKTEHDRDEGMANEKPEHQEAQGGKGKGGKKGTGLGKGEKYLIHDFAGVVKPGEMMLVVVSSSYGLFADRRS